MNTYHDLSIDNLFRLDGEVALVTGGGDGFGRIASMAYANAGASVAVVDLDKGKADAVVAEITTGGGHALALKLDVADRKELKSIIDEVAETLGGLHVLVNNAGITRRGPTLDMTDDDWDSVIEVNQTAVVLGSKAAASHMLKHGDGRIINLASIVGLVGNRHFSHIGYQAAKGAIVNITRGLAVEWAGHGIRVNAIAPTFFRTNFGAARMQSNPDLVAAIEADTPIGRFGEPWELAGGLLYLATKASSMVTGVTLPIDGGWTAV
ncbi:MAG: 3-oxoacyl-[acyl-carrier-protein] reductase 1 [Alphaproteobacteria bacterium MarineAlpha11_Bin1]|nr:MAG: 3-oxoacyl-[acyl-carrier-protein] reductase 1 [Alphaproteobacteria bacterium MarineAlpha11_Bin1]|tara:strand:+ start:6504 stop:7298 length:795 start_codon:yes stop_codon:yes gene_type:complete